MSGVVRHAMSGPTSDPIGDAAQEWLLLFATGEPTADDLSRFQLWRDADPRHAAAYDEARDLWNDAEDLHQAFAAPARPQAARPARRFLLAAGGLLAAGILVALVVGAPLWRALTADHRTGVGQQTMVTLPDGSTAWLNTDTAIDVTFDDTRRRVVLLRGEALFDVVKDPARPFDVAAVDGRTTAVGTSFAVRDLDEAATVTVVEGAVRVTSPAGAGTGTLVEAGQQLAYRRGQPPDAARRTDPDDATAWRRGTIAIRDRSLPDALREIERYRPGRIVLLGDTARFQPVTARIALRDIDGGIAALAATHRLQVVHVTDYLVILR